MNTNLREKTQEWMQLERKTLEQRKLADTFYDENLMDLVVEDFVERNQGLLIDEVKDLVVSVGTSYEPIVLSIKLFKPDRILFLCTNASESVLDKIVTYCNLKVQQYEKRKVNETNPLDIYREIKDFYLKWNKPDKMYIDFTGGTKAMSVAAAMAGAMIDVQLVYVGSDDYLVDFRKPNPGSETLYFITNPLAVFGDLEIEKALVLFGENNYAGAKEKLEVLKETIPDPQIRQQLNFVYLLARAYESWDSLDFAPAYEYMSKLNFQLKRDRIHTDYLLMDFFGALSQQEKVLAQMKDIPNILQEKRNMDILKNQDKINALMFTMYQNAMTRESQNKLDMATLLLYRLLEMIEQRRLSHYNLYVSDMDYGKMKTTFKRLEKYADKSPAEKLDILKNDVAVIKQGVFGKNGNNYLPDQVSLLEGYIILYAFQDPIVYQQENDNYILLKKIRSMVFLRNNSIFAHGLGPVKEADYMKFRNFVKEIFKRYCKIEKVDFDAYEKTMHWIHPMESANYSNVEA